MSPQRKLIIVFGILFSSLAHCQQFRFDHLTTNDGLSESTVKYILQDSTGFLWFATSDGLNRYDGYQFKVFQNNAEDSNSISSNNIACLAEDKENKLWITTIGGGLNCFNPKTLNFKRYLFDSSGVQLVNYLSTVFIDSKNRIWFGSMDGGAYRLDPSTDQIKRYQYNRKDRSSISSNSIYAILEDSKGNIWLSGRGGELNLYQEEDDNFYRIIYNRSRVISGSSDRSGVLFEDSEGNIWVGTGSDGAYKFQPKLGYFKPYYVSPDGDGLNSGLIMDIFEDEQNNIWFATDGGGINILDIKSDRFKYLTYDIKNTQCLSTNAIYCLFKDQSSTIWAGSYGAGLNYLSKYKYKFNHYTADPLNENSLSFKSVLSILEDTDGDIWVGTDGGGLNKFDPTSGDFTHYIHTPGDTSGIGTNVILQMIQDSDGEILLGSYAKGLSIYNKTNDTFRQYMYDPIDPTSIGGDNVWSIIEDSHGLYWIGLLGNGVDLFDKETETFTHFVVDAEDPTKIGNATTKVIYEDNQETVWIGTEGGGLYKYNRANNSFKGYRSQIEDTSSLSNDDVRSMFEDSKGNFWIGTSSGLNLMDREKETFRNYREPYGFPSSVINGIQEDGLGYLWISTNKGITQLDFEKHELRNYSISDGLQGNEFNYTADCKTVSGDLYFGGKNGFNFFNPLTISDNPNIPQLAITKFQIFNNEKDLIETGKGKNKQRVSIIGAKQIKLSHKQNVIGFEFSALDFANPTQNKYKYMLEGFDKDWNYADAGKREISYTNLDGGTYTLHIKGSNGDNVWNNEGIRLDIIITPPFYKRWWVISLVVFALIVFTLNYIQSREKKLKEDKEKLQSKIEEGLKEVSLQREKAIEKTKELERKEKEDKEQNWINNGLARFSEVLSQDQDNVDTLCRNLINFIAKQLDVAQGVIYLLNDNDEKHNFLELAAGYAVDASDTSRKQIEIGEGLVGSAYDKQEVVCIESLPKEYTKLSSGLGELPLNSLSLIPLKMNRRAIGIVELASFEPLSKVQIHLIEKMGETLTAVLTAMRATQKTEKLLESSRIQTEEMAAQEEELRQNLEEMQATQEELIRLKEADKKKQLEIRAREKELLSKLRDKSTI